jgi:hypothetical protein
LFTVPTPPPRIPRSSSWTNPPSPPPVAVPELDAHRGVGGGLKGAQGGA